MLGPLEFFVFHCRTGRTGGFGFKNMVHHGGPAASLGQRIGGAAMICGAFSLGMYLRFDARHKIVFVAAASSAVLLSAYSLSFLRVKFHTSPKKGSSQDREQVSF